MRVSPLQSSHHQAEAAMALYGPPEFGIALVQTFGELELEYAALRKSSVIIDRPDRATLEISGPDRVDFLNRMVTQELKGLGERRVARTFWLNRKGRIDADMTLIELGDRMIVDLDALAAERAIAGLSAFIITEDVAIRDATETMHRFSLHGPTAAVLLDQVTKPLPDNPPAADLAELMATRRRFRDHEVIVFRDDSAGEVGLELVVPASGVQTLYDTLLETGMDQSAETDAPRLGEENAGHALHAARASSRFRLRPAGWHAWNIARIESGRPFYYLDFGPDSLPHQSGVLHERVNFKKGCYLGQEVVARMESRGHSKTLLAAIRCESRVGLLTEPGHQPQAILPVTGGFVHPKDKPDADPIGQVTSSTLSPMLGQRPVCLAALKPDFAAPGTRVLVQAEGQRIEGEVIQGLRFWTKPAK